MNRHQLKKTLYFLLPGLFPLLLHAQLNAGACFSTFHLPAAKLRTTGLGITVQYEQDKKTVFELSAGYFGKKEPDDSIYSGGSTVKYNYNHSFYLFSADFLKYLAGTTYYKDKFAFYIGAGLSVLQRHTTTKLQTIPEQSEKESFTTFGFEYVMGAEVKLGIVRVFIRGRANIFLKYPVSMDDTTLPLLTNTQGGVLIPVIKHKRSHQRVVM
jgi:hypothetical protein